MKSIVNFILIIVFILLAIVIIFSFAADWQFNSAKELESAYLWQRAGEKYELAIKLDPFNAEYLAGYGDFLYRISHFQKDEITYLERAGELYRRAIRLNPLYAYYHLGLGLVHLKEGRPAFAELKDAVKNDPNNADINYTVGYAGLSLWNSLNAADREWVLQRLKQGLKIRPIESTEEKREKLKRIEMIKQGNLGQAWQGRPKDGDRIYEDGNMYWTGTVDKLINLPAGKSAIKIQAKGSPANDIWPYMIVELDGEEIGEAFVENPEWKEYDFRIDTNGGNKVLSVTFANDGENEKEDRNLYVGEARIEQ